MKTNEYNNVDASNYTREKGSMREVNLSMHRQYAYVKPL